ncbi:MULTISPECIES: adenylate/guanylate cyclase domain-containing protein [unclassified Bradyrhizobium]|uniref:adenylate/guanylate cyclase domain-containing protein n=1 Tax=unclassified Bradyrhizobium TaxID=2631580 RepID=UPI002478D214|nr:MULTISPECIES: adenylate/guanylate cyclase domain-containing protein [unclassified Bradyrhizobium]WGS19470.1 response regulator [Bradyrhizobium sp. ISRA463]WGS26308.1 response regulator [Bradyrhizobium sp. ISRA464]
MILVVDDNEDNRYLLVRRLRRLGYETVLTAEDGVEAIAALSEHPVDLMLLDVMMPGMNGHEVLRQIKAHPALREVRVIMISAVDDVDSVVHGIELGADDYLLKPFNPVILGARVGACLEKKRLRDREAHYLEEIEHERRRADEMLEAILPASALAELKATNEVKPRRVEDVTVLFSDIVGFTHYCDNHPAEQVVSELRGLVDAFEDIVDAHAMEKIKTIGDAFFATAGLLKPMQDGVLAAVHCARAMIETAQRLEPGWTVRIGIHSGPVIAGIMGRHQYMFDLWGDTVNTAARITAHADGGSIFMSATAWAQVRHCCAGRSRGFAELKGKGSLELFECHGLRAVTSPAGPTSDSRSQPPPESEGRP